jgi:hypothetical protein
MRRVIIQAHRTTTIARRYLLGQLLTPPLLAGLSGRAMSVWLIADAVGPELSAG